MSERKYLAISIKHTERGWKYGMPCVLWGYKRTPDDGPRCFAGYTFYPHRAELYTLEEFKAHYNEPWMKTDEPVRMRIDLCQKYREYDTVLIDADEYESYCSLAGFPLNPPE